MAGQHSHSDRHDHEPAAALRTGGDPAVLAANRRRTALAALLTGGFMGIEVIGGLLSGSLALIADAGHMLTDTVALGLAWLAFRMIDRPADGRRTYGFHRLQVVVAYTNGLALGAIAVWIIIEATGRVAAPVEILAGPMLAVAVAGLVVNVVAFALLHGGARDSLNLRGALAHVVGDLLGSVATIVAAGVIWLTGWLPIDPILSALVALLILKSAWSLVREAGHILLEGAPAALAPQEIADDLTRSVEGVEDVHHVHIWSLSEDRPMVTLHARARADLSPGTVTEAIKRRLDRRFHVTHATIEIEHDRCADAFAGTASTASSG